MTSDMRADLAVACNIVAMQGHADLNLGHVSVRIPGTDSMLMKPSLLGLEEIRPEHLITVGLDGTQRTFEGTMHHEVFIHSETYLARPDVHAVIHTHPRFAVAFGAAGQQLRPVSHDGILFAKNPPGLFTKTTDLILTAELGREVAAALGAGNALFLRNHGIVVAGASLQEAVVTAVFLERAVKEQLYARVFGDFTWTPESEVDQKYQHVFGDPMGEVPTLVLSYWDYLKRVTLRHNRLLGQGVQEAQ